LKINELKHRIDELQNASRQAKDREREDDRQIEALKREIQVIQSKTTGGGISG
jgi:chaperonin cofactor prefoldin